MRTQSLRLGLIGVGGLLLDAAVFATLVLTVLSVEVLAEGPILARAAAAAVAITAQWVATRFGTLRGRSRPEVLREAGEFIILSVVGLAVSLACLWVSHYLLGFESVVADLVAVYPVGVVLSALARLLVVRLWLARTDTTGAPA